MMATIPFMLMEFAKLSTGLLIALFHRQIAEFILHYERAVVVHFRQRGVMVPDVVTTRTAANIYFSLGIFVAGYELFRIWMMLHGA